MSRVTNMGVMMSCKAVTTNLFTVVGLLVETITAIVKPKGSLEASNYIRKPNIIVTYNIPVISTPLSILFFFISMLISNVISHRIIV